jgi:hypothetical protein
MDQRLKDRIGEMVWKIMVGCATGQMKPEEKWREQTEVILQEIRKEVPAKWHVMEDLITDKDVLSNRETARKAQNDYRELMLARLE